MSDEPGAGTFLNAQRDGFSLSEFEVGGKLVGLAFHSASLFLPGNQSAITIKGLDEEQKRNEIGKVEIGMRIKGKSVAAPGERSIVPHAVMAAIKACVMYGYRLDEFEEFIVATESWKEISKGAFTDIKDAINEVSDYLKDQQGVDLGHLSPRVNLHVQSACSSGGSAINALALQGITKKTLVVMVDIAEYAFGEAADETGGAGAIGAILEGKNASRGIPLISDAIDSDTKNVLDFIKPVFGDLIDERKGIAIISTHPIVFDQYSLFSFFSGVFNVLQKSAARMGFDLDNPKQMHRLLEIFALVMHTPVPTMPEKSLPYPMRHVAHVDKDFARLLGAELVDVEKMENVKRRKAGKPEVKVEEPTLNGFRNLREKLAYVVDAYTPMAAIDVLRIQSMKSGKGGHSKIARELGKKAEFLADAIIQKYEAIKRQYNIDATETGIVDRLQARMSDLKKADSGQQTLEGFEQAFAELRAHLTDYMKKEEAYSGFVRKAPIVIAQTKSLGMPAATEYASEVCNLYTGSGSLSLMSYLANEAHHKHIWWVHYGSGRDTTAIVLDKSGIDFSLVDAVKFNAEHEIAKRKEIDANIYKRIRANKPLPEEFQVPLTFHYGMIRVNPGAFENELRPYLEKFGIAERMRCDATRVARKAMIKTA